MHGSCRCRKSEPEGSCHLLVSIPCVLSLLCILHYCNNFSTSALEVYNRLRRLLENACDPVVSEGWNSRKLTSYSLSRLKSKDKNAIQLFAHLQRRHGQEALEIQVELC
jgi:hypothetical protein